VTKTIGRLWILAFAALLALAFGPPPLQVDILPRRAFAGNDLRATVRVERDQANRALVTVIDGPHYYSRSDEQLDGADAPRTRQITFLHLPEGHYAITSVVLRADGSRQTAHAEACFLGPTEDCQ
jgi:uncharacterized protein (DUF58 family)